MSEAVAVVHKSQEHSPSRPPPTSTDSNGSNGSNAFKITVEPLHHPEEMAHVEVPHNVENVPSGKTLMTGQALLAKKMAATGAAFYSPSDSLVSPCTQKLSSQKGKRWASVKAKPIVFGKSNLNNASSVFSPQKATFDDGGDQVNDDHSLKSNNESCKEQVNPTVIVPPTTTT